MDVIYRNPLDKISGYAAAGREYVYALLDSGINVKASIFNSGEDSALLTPDEQGFLLSLQDRQVGDDCAVIHNIVPDWWIRYPEKKNIGFLFWETTGFPGIWAKYLNNMDTFWVCWDETKRSLNSVGITDDRIFVVPPVVNTKVFHPEIQPLNLNTEKSFKFLSVFQYTHRKGADILLKAYLEEFNIDEDVCLIIKSYGVNASQQQEKLLKDWIKSIKLSIKKNNYPKIIFRGSVVPNNVFPNFLKTADVFVLPSRGEGLGMPMLQSMACGVPVITTSWGAQTQFVNNDNGWLIKSDLVNVQGMPHCPAYEPGQKWAEPDKEHLKYVMREAFNNEQQRKEKSFKSRKTVENNYSYKVTKDKLVKAL